MVSSTGSGGGGGRARTGGEEGNGGAPVSRASFSGVFGLVGVRTVWRLRLCAKLRGSDADRGLGAYALLSFIAGFGAFGVDFVFAKGISSATSITELSAMLPSDTAGEIGEGSGFSALPATSLEGTAAGKLCGNSVTFLQLALLEAMEDGRAAGSAQSSFGIGMCGLAFLNRCLGIGAGAFTTASIVRVVIGRSRIVRVLIRSSRSFRDIEKAPRICELLLRDLGLLIGPVQFVTTVGFIISASKL